MCCFAVLNCCAQYVATFCLFFMQEALKSRVVLDSARASISYVSLCVCESVFHLHISCTSVGILTELITVTHYQVHMTLMTLRRSLGQRSRSVSDDYRNLVNLIAPEPLKRYEPKLT